MITTVKDLIDRLSLFRPDAKLEFLTGRDQRIEILSIYSENCSFRDGKPINTENDKLVCIDLEECGGD